MKAPDWSAEVKEGTTSKDDTITALYTPIIPKDWYMYSSDFDPNFRPMVTYLMKVKVLNFHSAIKQKINSCQ